MYYTALKLRDILQSINQKSFTFVQVNKKYQLDRLDDNQLKEVVKIYSDILNEIKSLLNEKGEYVLREATNNIGK
jgi:hypothetical protein